MESYQIQALGLAAVLASAALLALSLRNRSKTDDQGRKTPPVYSPGIPYLGTFRQFAKDPLEIVRQGQKRCGDCFTVKLLVEDVTFLVGPKAHIPFFESSEEDLDQGVSTNACCLA